MVGALQTPGITTRIFLAINFKERTQIILTLLVSPQPIAAYRIINTIDPQQVTNAILVPIAMAVAKFVIDSAAEFVTAVEEMG